ncbi:hypothetical protein [Acidocella sp.]|uniref:hypothetical protein n=1 Tax=Acidocella sp. TaxID=50710 RepID=UPI0018485ABD|nr:hypothetical protein [Acidocella sp.]NNM57795.1 hypothetical protein [Acidocella sp.]
MAQPVLTAVPRKNLPDRQDFSGGYDAMPLCRNDVAGRWWEGMMRWGRLYRPALQRAEA